jgi:hypothetical protein
VARRAGNLSLMLRRRRASFDTAQRDGAASNLHADEQAGWPAQEEGLADAHEDEAPESWTLETLCTCGHTRREHTGLRIAFNGRCLGCDCEAFTPRSRPTRPDDELLARVRGAIAHVERLEQIARGLTVDRASSGHGRGASI